jgi:hypothetical protein
MMMTNIPIPPLKDNQAAPRLCFNSWLWLILAAAAPRILAVFLLPNAFGDAYSYLHEIDVLRAQLASGTFTLRDLFGFWLPLYQFTCALISVIAGHAFYISRLVSAACGIGTCLLVRRIAFRLTSDRLLSWLAFALIALNPLHIFYSASALTDVPHSFLVMACLDAMMRKRVKMASVWAAAAGLVRPESWMLIVLLPAWHFLRERRIAFSACIIPLLAPAIWFFITWEASGNPFTYFAVRNRYVMEYTAANPAFAAFPFSRIGLDALRLLDSTNFAVLAGCLVGAWFMLRYLIRSGFRKAVQGQLDVIAANVFFLAYPGFLLLAYLTGNQPDIWSRYGLLFFALGLPVLAWTFQTIDPSWQAWPLRIRWISKAVLAVFLLQMSMQVAEVAGSVHREEAKNQVCGYLREIYRKQPDRRFICDDVAIEYISGIPWEKFVFPWSLPGDPNAWSEQLRAKDVEYLICNNTEVSLATKLFPELRKGQGTSIFRLVKEFDINYLGHKVWVYQVLENN